jgi:hypothetical protein
MAQTKSPSDPHGGQLNIVFHGTLAFVLDGDVKVVVPEIDKFHIVAGTFREEQPLQKGAHYRLVGVKPASGPAPHVATDANVFLVGVKLQAGAAVFCDFNLQTPAGFRSLDYVNLKGAALPEFPPPFAIPKDVVALTHVMTYDFDDVRSLAILDHKNNRFPWAPKLNGRTGTVNLHVYCDPQDDAAPEPMPAFVQLVGMFGVRLTIDLKAIGPFAAPPEVYPEIRGLEDADEVQDFSHSHPGLAKSAFPIHCGACMVLPPDAPPPPDPPPTPARKLNFSVSIRGEHKN